MSYESSLGAGLIDTILGTNSGAPTLTKTVATPATPSMVQAKAATAQAAVIAASPAQRRLPIAAVRAFQQVYGNGLAVDGVYGTNTRSALVTVTGDRNLPAVEAAPASLPSPSDLIPDLPPAEEESASSWLVPVAVVGTVVTVAGYLFFRKRPVRANRKSRLRGAV